MTLSKTPKVMRFSSGRIRLVLPVGPQVHVLQRRETTIRPPLLRADARLCDRWRNVRAATLAWVRRVECCRKDGGCLCERKISFCAARLEHSLLLQKTSAIDGLQFLDNTPTTVARTFRSHHLRLVLAHSGLRQRQPYAHVRIVSTLTSVWLQPKRCLASH